MGLHFLKILEMVRSCLPFYFMFVFGVSFSTMSGLVLCVLSPVVTGLDVAAKFSVWIIRDN